MSKKILVILLSASLVGAILLTSSKMERKTEAREYVSKLMLGKIEKDKSGVEIVIVGDVMLGRTVNYKAWEKKDWGWVFADTKDLLSDADIAIANLESPLVSECPLSNEGMIFCGDTGWVGGIVKSGIDVVSVANNHSTNYFEDGLKETVGILEEASIGVIGYGKTYLKGVDGVMFAVLGFNDVGRYPYIDNAERELVKENITKTKDLADVVIVYFHWGAEYVAEPSDYQRELARYAVDSGADVVVGTHSHWTQTNEKYNGKLIVYSLGNFVFDQMWSEETRRGHVLRMKFEGNTLSGYELIPVRIEEYGRPEIVAEY